MNRSSAFTSITAALLIGCVAAPAATAATASTPLSSSSTQITSAASEDAQVANLAAAFSALQKMPESLQQLPPSDPAVQSWIQSNIPNPPRPGGVVTPQFNPFTCAAAIAEFAISVGLPASKLITIAREAGGFTKFARYVFDFVRKGTLPADASDELIDLLLKVTGVGSLSACL